MRAVSANKCYESMLFTEDLESERGLCCLACRAEVGKISWLGSTPGERRIARSHDGDRDMRLVAVAVDRRRVQAVIGTREFVRFSCGCGKTSIYHLCLN
ncbi:MAG: hypothetical protein H6832_16950 [Planctomycetes bacterium]|nr:hypothetical protein [Planctomycetota bacterium]MCB9920091.1 hypothetical protein [Planctomycetota bacterium]